MTDFIFAYLKPMRFFKLAPLGLVVLPVLLSACANTPERRGPENRERGEQTRQNRPQTSGTFVRPISLLFADMAMNGDKRLSLSELEAGVEKEWSTFERAPSAMYFANWSSKALGSTDAAPTLMMFDKDLNGVVSKPEFSALLAERFTRFDKNKDDIVDRSELIVAFEAPQGQRSRGGPSSGEGRGKRGGAGGGVRPPR